MHSPGSGMIRPDATFGEPSHTFFHWSCGISISMIFMGIAIILVTLVAWSTAGEDWGC